MDLMSALSWRKAMAREEHEAKERLGTLTTRVTKNINMYIYTALPSCGLLHSVREGGAVLGVCPILRTFTGRSGIHWARNAEVTKVLLGFACDVNDRVNGMGDTPFLCSQTLAICQV